MTSIAQNLQELRREIPGSVTLVAVSKNHPVAAVLEAWESGQKIFGENRVQEILSKQPELPGDIEWHMIGHLQTNKVKLIAPFIAMIQSVDSMRLLNEISSQALKNDRVIDCLLQVFIATEESKFGFDERELFEILREMQQNPLPGVRIRGLMGMATFTDDTAVVRQEFRGLKLLFEKIRAGFFQVETSFDVLSMGMSGDYRIAIEEGGTVVRVGTRIFGSR